MESVKKPGILTLKEFCLRMEWGYPLPKPGTKEAEEWIDKVMKGEKPCPTKAR